jgi:hypothetical protein
MACWLAVSLLLLQLLSAPRPAGAQSPHCTGCATPVCFYFTVCLSLQTSWHSVRLFLTAVSNNGYSMLASSWHIILHWTHLTASWLHGLLDYKKVVQIVRKCPASFGTKIFTRLYVPCEELFMRDFRFPRRQVWSSEFSGIYCRVVKSMSPWC